MMMTTRMMPYADDDGEQKEFLFLQMYVCLYFILGDAIFIWNEIFLYLFPHFPFTTAESKRSPEIIIPIFHKVWSFVCCPLISENHLQSTWVDLGYRSNLNRRYSALDEILRQKPRKGENESFNLPEDRRTGKFQEFSSSQMQSFVKQLLFVGLVLVKFFNPNLFVI